MRQREMIARELLSVAKSLSAAADGDEEVDENFRAKVTGIKSRINKLAQKKTKRLKSLGVDAILKPSTATVEDLVNVLDTVLSS